MSNFEKYIQMGKSMTDGQLAYMLEVIEQTKQMLDEIEDDRYCKNLYLSAQNDDSEAIPFEEVLRKDGLTLDDLRRQNQKES